MLGASATGAMLGGVVGTAVGVRPALFVAAIGTLLRRGVSCLYCPSTGQRIDGRGNEVDGATRRRQRGHAGLVTGGRPVIRDYPHFAASGR